MWPCYRKRIAASERQRRHGVGVAACMNRISAGRKQDMCGLGNVTSSPANAKGGAK